MTVQSCDESRAYGYKIGVFALLARQMNFDDALDYFVKNGVEAVEIGFGGYISG